MTLLTMKNNYRSDLLEELSAQSSLDGEINELLDIAFKLNNLSGIRRSYEFKKAFIKKLGIEKADKNKFYFFSPRLFIPVLIAVIFLLVSGTFVYAQKSKPGNLLYPVKRLSEDMVTTVKPELKQEILQRRIEENKEIQNEKENSENPGKTEGKESSVSVEKKRENNREKDKDVKGVREEKDQDIQDNKNSGENERKDYKKEGKNSALENSDKKSDREKTENKTSEENQEEKD